MKKPLYKTGQTIFYEGTNDFRRPFINYYRAVIEDVCVGLKGIFYIVKPLEYRHLGNMPILEEDIYLKVIDKLKE